MNKQTKALKMAIEAMSCISQSRGDPLLKAIRACKEALEQPAQICEVCGSTMTDEELAERKKTNPKLISCCPDRKMLEQPAQWISVKDRLPEFVTVTNYEKSSDDVLMLIDGKHVYIGAYIFDTWSKTDDFCMRDLDGGYEVVEGMKVTHWMPLPEAPKE